MKRVFVAIAAIVGIAGLSGQTKAAPIIVPQDIVFLVDSSGSIGEQAFEEQRAFLSSVYNNEIVGNGPSRTGLIQFATNVTTLHSISDDQTPSTVNTVIENMVYTGGFTNTPGAINAAVNMFNAHSNDPNPKLMVLITDGNPHLPNGGDTNVCQFANDIFSAGIQTAIVGIGANWDPNQVDCLVDDPAFIFEVDSFSSFDVLLADQTYTSLFGQGYIIPDPNSVPTPGALAFLGLGLIGVASIKRRAV